MKKLVLLLPIVLGLSSCNQPQLDTHTFEFDAIRYEFGVFQETELGCTRIEDDVMLLCTTQSVNLNHSYALPNGGDKLNIVNLIQNQVGTTSIQNLRRRMVEEYNDSAVMEFGSLNVFIIKK